MACIGLENQTESDADMPLRIMGYDGAEYRAQLTGNQHERYPVITIVLYFGYKKHWDKPLSLVERLSVPEKFRPFVNDYKVNLFEIAFLDMKKLNFFKSDFKVVADYFVQKRITGDYVPNTVQLNHVQETLSLLSIMTADQRFENVLNDDIEDSAEGRKEIRNMCDVLDRIENNGVKKGKKEMAISLYKQGVELSVIANAAGVAIVY